MSITITRRQWLIIVLAGIAFGLLFGPPGAHAAPDAPDPVPTNGMYYVNATQVTVGGEVFTDIAYDVRLSASGNVAANVPDAPACHAKTVLTFCCNIVKVTKPSGITYTIVGHTITLGNVPVGSSHIIVRVLGTANIYSDALPYTMTADDGRTWNKTTDGVKCSPTAVTMAGFAASADGFQWRDLAIMGLVVLAVLIARWAARERKGK